MYKVMMIDDEEAVRWGLRDLLSWEEEGFEICPDGKDGRDGLKKLLEHRPDLALVDIRMPGLSGIELIEAARGEGFAGDFIILTGYSEFEYAKSAISFGVRDYLLKPIDEDELLEAVRKIRGELEKRDRETAWHHNNEDIAKEELLRKILLCLETEEKLQEEMKQYGMEWEDGILCAAILTDKEMQQQQTDFRLWEKTQDFLKEETCFIGKTVMENSVVLIQSGMDDRSFKEQLAGRNERIRKKFGSGLRIAVGHTVSSWRDLCFSYEFAQFLMEHEFLFGRYDVISMEAMEEEQKAVENPTTEYFAMLMEVGDLDGIREGVERFGEYCTRQLMKEMDIKIQIMYNLMIIKGWMEKKYDSVTLDVTDRMNDLNQASELDCLLDLYTQILQDICRQIGSDSSGTVIKRMYYYMEKNYEKDLKLEGFARMFNYNSNYLGKIFRREIGDSFNNILDTIRIGNAKRLLEETDLKVYQISEQVGYGNIDYFYLKFKKYVGISPKEYKKEKNR